jgi:hypothetical protein
LGIGDWAQSPIPNPQSPIPNPQSPFYLIIFFNEIIINLKNYFYFILKKNKKIIVKYNGIP